MKQTASGERMDYTLLITCVGLTLFGILMVYSASPVAAYGKYGDSAFFVKKQIVWAVLALIAGFVFYKRKTVDIKKMMMPGLVTSIILLFAVHIPHLGHKVGGATRWFNLGPLSFQPFELVKIFYVIYLAEIFSTESFTVLKRFIRTAMVTGIIILGLIFQKDLGAVMIIVSIYLAILIIVGSYGKMLIGLLPVLVMLVVALIKFEPFRLKRFMAFLDPWKDPLGSGYQSIQSFIAVGSGGIFGVGFSNSQQKFLFLPTPHTDYIFSVVAEELGLIGSVILLSGFFMVLSRGVFIAINVQDKFNKFLALGLTLIIITQVCMNVAVSIGLMPTKGTTLPFISYGGSSLMVACVAMGMLLSVSKLAYGRGK
ncbi:MAG: putative lipid II flippase FtsW [bacterium]